MRPTRPWVLAAGAWVVLAVGAGCDGSNRVYPVQGKITFEGKQFQGGGAIAFVPLGNQAGKAPGGEIAEDGSYQLTTYQPGDGSMIGDFRVVIMQVVEKEPESTPDGQKASMPIQIVPMSERIPASYADYQNSPLTARVEAKKLNEFDFDLKRDGRPAEQPRPGARLDAPSRGPLAWSTP